MFSIGILGFLVWSLMVALPFCEIRVKNLAICWDSLLFISTLNSKNLISYTRSAGNFNTLNIKNTSETKSEESLKFDMFNKLNKNVINNE